MNTSINPGPISEVITLMGGNNKMELWLIDINPNLVQAWQKEFEGIPNVGVRLGNILDYAENTIVSPANGYGLMDGGIDQIYTDYFGMRPQQEILERIKHRPEGYLPVGSAVIVETGNAKIPYMISAPTMLVPQEVDKVNVFFCDDGNPKNCGSP